jgi:hypothetical protein
MMRKFLQRALISGAAGLAIVSAVGGADLLGEAHADPTPCVNATNSCQPPATNGLLRPQMVTICQPGGPKAGAFCRQVPATRAA